MDIFIHYSSLEETETIFLICVTIFILIAEGDWLVTINTAEAAEYADIVMCVYGDNPKEPSINFLGTAGQDGLFGSNVTDEFKVF